MVYLYKIHRVVDTNKMTSYSNNMIEIKIVYIDKVNITLL